MAEKTPLDEPNQAIEALRKQIELQPRNPEAKIQLAKALLDANRPAEAADFMLSAIADQPSNLAACYNNLGVIYHGMRRWSDAVRVYRQAVALEPNYFLAHLNLGNALREEGNLREANSTYRKAVELDNSNPAARAGLGLVLLLQNFANAAIEQLLIAARLDPNDARVFLHLAMAHGLLGDHASMIANIRRAIAISPTDANLHDNLLMYLNYSRGADLPVVLEESRRWNDRHTADISRCVQLSSISVDAERALRIGYISADFREHPVGQFLEPVLANHDRRRYTVVCYSDAGKPDAVTDRLRRDVDLWRPITQQSNERVARQICDDQIDILIDLAGHTLDNRLSVLAAKPAPIEISWLGYPNTTGLSAIDYRITDRFADPPTADAFYTEKLIRLPDAFFVYLPPTDAPAVGPLPLRSAGSLTFGSFNKFIKISAQAMNLWADLLNALPNSRLIIAGAVPDGAARGVAFLQQRGISPGRIEIAPWMNFANYLALHLRVDITLDSYPWSGHTTACHSLWMGVPVLSLVGPTAVSRATFSILSNLKLQSDWAASTPAEFVQLGQRWAERTDELAMLRASLRDRMRESALCDAGRFTANLESAFRAIWRKRCES